jgi:hypothetical protein
MRLIVKEPHTHTLDRSAAAAPTISLSLSSDAQLHSVAETGAGLGPPYSRGHQPKLMSGVYTVVMDEIHLSFYY